MTTVVGLMADPGLPAVMAGRVRMALESELARRVDGRDEWRVEVVDDTVPLDDEGHVELIRRAEELNGRHGWDLVLYITDLPPFDRGRPVVAEISRERRAAVISLPALGVFRLRKRLAETLARLVEHLYRGSVGTGTEAEIDTSDPERPEALTALTPLSRTSSAAGDVVEQVYSRGYLSRVRLLTGMVLSNQPGRLPKALTRSAAAATAAGAYGVFFGSIWTLAISSGVDRLMLVTLLALVGMTLWLVFTNGLWARSTAWSGRRWAAMDNIATLVTVGIAVVMLYAGLFLALLIAALVVVPPDYLATTLGETPGVRHYLKLTWLATSLGTMAGAIGSSFDDDATIRNATYSRREAERRALHRQDEDRQDEDRRGRTEAD